MHFDLGSQYVRAKYITDKQFLKPDYDPVEVYVQTTVARRTIDSATAQLAGLFSRERTFPELDPHIQLDVIPDSINTSIHVNQDNCPRFSEIQTSVQNSTANIDSQAQIAELFEDQFFPRLRQLTGMTDADTQTMFDVSNYLMWATMSGLDLAITLTPDDLRYINATNNNDVWADYLAQKEEVRLSSFDFLHQILEFINVIEGQDWQSQPYFNKYFHGPEFPKLIFYSAHEETLYPFLNAFDYVMIEKVAPGSALFLDFFTF